MNTHHVSSHVGDEVLQGLDTHRPDVHGHDGSDTQEELLHLPEGLSPLPEMVETGGVR